MIPIIPLISAEVIKIVAESERSDSFRWGFGFGDGIYGEEEPPLVENMTATEVRVRQQQMLAEYMSGKIDRRIMEELTQEMKREAGLRNIPPPVGKR